MNLHDLKFFEMAQKLNSMKHEELKEKELHFRGNLNSFSLISLAHKTPEVGLSNLKSEDDAESALSKIKAKLAKGLGRSTPEKVLQAWTIKSAINNHMSLPFGDNLSFVTSELALNNVFINSKNKEGKLVNDLLALDDKGVLWVIELKSGRDKTTLMNQVNDFMSVIETNRGLFSGLLTTLCKQKWHGEIRGMVVWPHAKTSPLDWGEIVEICYQPSFTFMEY